MKHECNVARDLMPLALDGAASEESQKLLAEHLEECADCKTYFAGMEAALPLARETSEKEQKAFDEAARKLRKKRRFRMWRRLLTGILIGIVATVGAAWGWTRLTQDFTEPVYYGTYNVFLSQLQDGSVSVNVDFRGNKHNMMIVLEEYQENGEQILYISNYTSRIRQELVEAPHNYSCTRLQLEDMEYFTEIRQGVPGEYAVVWQAGNAIPAASPEMESFFAIRDQMEMIRFRETEDGKMIAVSFEDNQRYQELDEQLMAVRKTVPEWQ